MSTHDRYVTREESREAVAIAALLGFISGALTVAVGAAFLAEAVLWPR